MPFSGLIGTQFSDKGVLNKLIKNTGPKVKIVLKLFHRRVRITPPAEILTINIVEKYFQSRRNSVKNKSRFQPGDPILG